MSLMAIHWPITQINQVVTVSGLNPSNGVVLPPKQGGRVQTVSSRGSVGSLSGSGGSTGLKGSGGVG